MSAICWPSSTPAHAFDLCSVHFDILYSSATFAELDNVVRRNKLDRHAPREERVAFLRNFKDFARPIVVREAIQACRDPHDDKFLELAVSGGASLLITGDKDLLELHPFRGIDILTSGEFLVREDDRAKR